MKDVEEFRFLKQPQKEDDQVASNDASARHALVIVDPQNDFCEPKGALYVPGADEDMLRLAKHIRTKGSYYTDVLVSLDSHDRVAIFHPKFWVNEDGNHPAAYTLITRQDFETGEWRPASPWNVVFTKRCYEAIEKQDSYGIMVWPEHCIVSTWGHQICDAVRAALDEWRDATGRSVRYAFKGESPYSEQFSIFDGPDAARGADPTSEVLIARLSQCDSVTFCGEAISHCVHESVISYMTHTRHRAAKQDVRLLTDCASPVVGFDRALSERKIAETGVVLTKTADG